MYKIKFSIKIQFENNTIFIMKVIGKCTVLNYVIHFSSILEMINCVIRLKKTNLK